MVYFCVAADV